MPHIEIMKFCQNNWSPHYSVDHESLNLGNKYPLKRIVTLYRPHLISKQINFKFFFIYLAGSACLKLHLLHISSFPSTNTNASWKKN
jgi:hypothetical protein